MISISTDYGEPNHVLINNNHTTNFYDSLTDIGYLSFGKHIV